MSTLSFKVLDLDFPAGSKNKTATLVTGENEALLVDAAFTRADGHRLAAEILDSGKTLTTVFVSHADPDFYFGAEVVADAFPEATFVATPIVIEHIQHSYEGKLKAWAALGAEPPHPPGRPGAADRRPHSGGPPLRAQGRPDGAARPPLPVAGRAPRPARRRPALPAGARLGRRHPHPRRPRRLDRPARRNGRPRPAVGRARPPPPRHRCRRLRHRRHPRLPDRLRGGARPGRRRRRAQRRPRQALSRTTAC